MIEKAAFYNEVWQTPYLPPIPDVVEGVQTCRIPLARRESPDWSFLFDPLPAVPSPFAEQQDCDFAAAESWQAVVVPGSLVMQGFDIENNIEYYYRRTVTLPVDFSGKRVFIRFEGVYSHARVWVNGRHIKTHVGGFTPWDCELTAFADQAQLTLTVGVADLEGKNPGVWNPDGEMVSDAAWASHYAHCNIGGILRDVTLFCLPQSYVARTHIETALHADHKNATLRTEVELHAPHSALELTLTLLDRDGNIVGHESHTIDETYVDSRRFPEQNLTMNPPALWAFRHKKYAQNDKRLEARFLPHFAGVPTDCRAYCAAISLEISHPLLWDAEHPNLYTLQIELAAQDTLLQTTRCRVGLREITYGGMRGTQPNKVYINGREIKLRGVCRHDISHLYGRSVPDEDLREEILAYRRNNINHIRTSHYPASEYLLDVCDELGIYVEQENAACFKGANGNETDCPPQDFLCSFAEMLEAHRNHPSVVIWSLANESGFEHSYAFRREFEYAKHADKTRPVIFSYPHTVHSKPLPYDIRSHHYKKVTSPLGDKKIPVLHDEFAHVACYNTDRLRMDNSCRRFWGESLRIGWDNIFRTDGALGCAIWAGIDDVFYLPPGTKERHQNHSPGPAAGYGEWGAVLDVYKREKPEAYLTKKAFSPVKLDEQATVFGESKLSLTFYNRFDHTSLSEVQLVCSDEEGRVFFDSTFPISVAPHLSGTVTIPHPGCKSADIKLLREGLLLDTYHLSRSSPARRRTAPGTQFSCEESGTSLRIKCAGLFAEIDRHTGALQIRSQAGGDWNALGPRLYCGNQQGKIQNVACVRSASNVTVTLDIRCKNGMKFRTRMVFDQNGIVVTAMPCNARAKRCPDGVWGVEFPLSGEIESVGWRSGDACAYPESHIFRPGGIASRDRPGCLEQPDQYGENPAWDWKDDMRNDFLFTHSTPDGGPSTNDFRTQRTDLEAYTVRFKADGGFTILPDTRHIGGLVAPNGGTDCLRLSRGSYYPDLLWGNYCGEKVSADAPQEISFTLTAARDGDQEA